MDTASGFLPLVSACSSFAAAAGTPAAGTPPPLYDPLSGLQGQCQTSPRRP